MCVRRLPCVALTTADLSALCCTWPALVGCGALLRAVVPLWDGAVCCSGLCLPSGVALPAAMWLGVWSGVRVLLPWLLSCRAMRPDALILP